MIVITLEDIVFIVLISLAILICAVLFLGGVFIRIGNWILRRGIKEDEEEDVKED